MKQKINIVIANIMGTFLEYFDYALYGFAIPTIAPLFFPSSNLANSMLIAWTTLLISLVVRPIGAVVFGYLGDRLGRKKILSFSVIVMAIPTIVFGLLPTYSQIGIVSPILVLICRIMQGLAISAEYNGCCIYLIETFEKNKSFAASAVVFACGLGILSASVLTLLFTSHNQATSSYFSFWRLPFIIAGLTVGIAGLYLRRNLPETPVFQKVKNDNKILKSPLTYILKTQKAIIARMLILSGYSGTATYILTIYLSVYLRTELKINTALTLLMITISSLSGTLLSPLFGFFTDLKGARIVMLLSLIVTMLLVVPTFIFFQVKKLIVATLLLTIICSCNAAFCSALASFLPLFFLPEIKIFCHGY